MHPDPVHHREGGEDAELLRCRGLVVGWNHRALLPPIDLSIRRGRFTAVLGRNGSGKSTWFKTILGQTPPIAGSVEQLPALEHIAYVPQSTVFDRILPLTARDVVMQGRLHCNNFLWPFPRKADRVAVSRALEQAGAGDLAMETFRDLSKGQRQRIMFARMLATEADLALLDEPTAAMDYVAEREAMDQLAHLAKAHDIAVVLISHALDIAERHADDILFFDRVAGEVVFGPKAEVMESPIYRRHLRGE
ncbi:MAG: metal ABC transporter ATP-binding protein [Myxococcales bacterium]|nr:metal ABC transporter ATP-binding protein [Myxococcales bacterium]